MRELFAPANLDIIIRSLVMAARGDARLGDHRVPDRLFRGALCARANGRRSSILAIMLPLWSSYLVKVYAWKLILAKEGIITWLADQLHLVLAARCAPRRSR